MTRRYICAATAADHEALLGIWERSVRATHEFLAPADVDGLRPLVAQALESEALAVWVLATADDTPIAWIGLSGSHIEALFVAPEAHGTGGGRQLVGHAQARSPAAPLTVDVNEQNPGATRFYERLGFARIGRSPRDATGRPFPILHLRRPAPE